MWQRPQNGIEHWAAVAKLGYKPPRLLRTSSGDDVEAILGQARSVADTSDVLGPVGDEPTVVTVCTFNCTHHARALFRSLRRFHPDVECVLCVADAERHGFPELPGVWMVSPRSLGNADFPYLALKYSATDLCCALKPLVLRWLAKHGRKRLVYMDADICVYAPMTGLFDAAGRVRAVVVPHILSPLPNPQNFWERPSMGDLAHAGVFNAGLFGLSVDSEVEGFLDRWSDLVSQPGAFLPSLGGQWEQNSFNWITSFIEGVSVLRDPAYNVAYWNLHERSLRWRGFDGGDNEWTVNGKPLVCFHFSGYRPSEPLVLSHHDRRHSLLHSPSLALLTEDYARRLVEDGADDYAGVPYGYDTFPSGVPIDGRMRKIFKEDEVFLRRECDPWDAEGEAYYCESLWMPVPYRRSLMPVLLQSIYEDRSDLRQAWPNAHWEPDPVFGWLIHHGLSEAGYRQLYDRYRQVIPHPQTTSRLAGSCAEVLADGEWVAPLTHQRPALIRFLRERNRTADAESLRGFEGEIPFVSTIRFVQHVYSARTDLQGYFPDVLYSDAPRFADWLRKTGAAEVLAPKACADEFLQRCQGRSLARVFSYLNRTPELVRAWPLALLGVDWDECARSLLSLLRHGLEFDLEDVIMAGWTIAAVPAAGLELTLELLPHLAAVPSTRLPEGQDELLRGVLASKPALARRLEEIREQQRLHGLAEVEWLRAWEQEHRKKPVRAAEFLTPKLRRALSGRIPDRRNGVNLFGYFKSPIGLGEMSRGLSQALSRSGLEVAESVVGNVAMERDLAPADFIRKFRYEFDTNIFVSYPHNDALIQHQYPEWMLHRRRNIAYLAWEQRDGSPYWAPMYAGFEQVWALSSFAAESLERSLGRRVEPVPCVLDIGSLPQPGSKREFGLAEDALVVLYVFDANSSIERKNPEGAIEAFAAAFGTARDVQLCIKISNSARLDHRTRVRAFLRDAASLGDRVKIIAKDLPRVKTLRLISSVDCYFSPHRAEGFGYTCAEAMAYGVPVVATGYSGNLDFMDARSAYLVEAKEVEVRVAEGPFRRGSVWAEPVLESAVSALRRIRDDRAEARLKGAAGRRMVEQRLSLRTIGERVSQLLGEPPAVDGPHPAPPRPDGVGARR